MLDLSNSVAEGINNKIKTAFKWFHRFLKEHQHWKRTEAWLSHRHSGREKNSDFIVHTWSTRSVQNGRRLALPERVFTVAASQIQFTWMFSGTQFLGISLRNRAFILERAPEKFTPLQMSANAGKRWLQDWKESGGLLHSRQWTDLVLRNPIVNHIETTTNICSSADFSWLELNKIHSHIGW